MYWIYLIIFTFIVFVPTFINHGAFIFNIVQTQEFVILILGSLGFFMFLAQEKRLKKNQSEKIYIQRQVNRMSKDLTNSYTYIGEINRKLDILENIALGFPETSNLTSKKQKQIYESIMGAVQIFGKSEHFAIRFVNMTNLDILKEIKNLPDEPLPFSIKDFDDKKSFFENDEFIIATSSKSIDNIFSYIVIKKNNPAHSIEDPEIMKTLAAQALFIFVFTMKKRQIKCII